MRGICKQTACAPPVVHLHLRLARTCTLVAGPSLQAFNVRCPHLPSFLLQQPRFLGQNNDFEYLHTTPHEQLERSVLAHSSSNDTMATVCTPPRHHSFAHSGTTVELIRRQLLPTSPLAATLKYNTASKRHPRQERPPCSTGTVLALKRPFLALDGRHFHAGRAEMTVGAILCAQLVCPQSLTFSPCRTNITSPCASRKANDCTKRASSDCCHGVNNCAGATFSALVE